MSVVMAAVLMLVGQDGATMAAKPAPAPEKKICRSEVSTASRLDAKKTCRTRAEWEALDRENGGAYRRDLDRSRATSAG